MSDTPRDGNVLFDWTPEPGDQIHELDDIAEQYLVVEVPQALSGLIVYAKYHGEWHANPWTSRPLIRHLLKQVGAINT
jgi:hypothetical protein